jgi:hypothetical protein
MPEVRFTRVTFRLAPGKLTAPIRRGNMQTPISHAISSLVQRLGHKILRVLFRLLRRVREVFESFFKQ